MKKRMIYLDVLNILAILAVIMLHHNGIVHTYSNTRAWKTSLIVETIFYWAVPIFLMITGATLMNYREKYDTKTFFKKRIFKVVIPFIFWAVIMLLWKVSIGQLVINNFSVKEILNIFFNNKEETTYYYVFLIIGIYLTLPLISVLSEERYKGVLWYTVISFFVFNSFIPVICSFLGISYNNNLTIQIGSYLFFVILGYLLSNEDFTKKKRIIIYILGILSVLFRYIITYYLSIKSNELVRTFFGYTQFHSILLATAVFIFVKNINWDKLLNDKLKNILFKISSCSFAIYLIHKIIMYYELSVLNLKVNSWQWRTIGAILTYFICLTIVYILKKIPIVKKVVA